MNRSRLSTLIVALCLCCLTAPADAAVLDGIFTPSDQATAMTLGPDGAVWFVLGGGSDKEIGRIAPNGTITEYDLAQDVEGITVGPDVLGGPNNRIWVSYNGGVTKIDPANPGAPVAYPAVQINFAEDIEADRDGYLWVVDSDGGLVKLSPSGTVVGEADEQNSGGQQVELGGDGRMYWSDFGDQTVWVTPTTAPYTTTAAAGNLGAGPQDLAYGEGQIVFGLPGNRLGRFALGGAPVFTTDTGGDAGFGTVFASDSAFWVTRFARDGLGRLGLDGSYTTPIAFPAGSGPRTMTRGAGNTLWVALEGSKQIARVSGVTAPPPPQGGGGGAGGGGVGGGVVRDTIRPRLSGLRLDVKRRRLSVALSEAATLRVAIERRTSGRRVGRRCLAPKKGRGGKRCVRFVRTRFLRRTVGVGRQRVSLGKKMTVGRYRVSVVAVDRAGNRSAAVRRAFVVQKRKPGRR